MELLLFGTTRRFWRLRFVCVVYRRIAIDALTPFPQGISI